MGNDLKVHIIIVNYINWKDTLACLGSVLNSTYPHFRIYVIDNRSPNGSMQHLVEWAKDKPYKLLKLEEFDACTIEDLPGLCLVQHEINAGFAAANNVILRKISGSHGYAWLLNPDMMVEPETLQELIICQAQNDPMAITGAMICNFHTRSLVSCGGGRVNFNTAGVKNAKTPGEAKSLDYISGSSLFTRTENFRQFGLLPEQYFLYWEETDWCYGAKLKGAQLNLCESAICYDRISTVIGKGYLAHYY